MIYQGDTKVKQAKLQTHRGQFEILKMKEEEHIVEYPLRVNNVVNITKGLGEQVDEFIIFQKVLRSLQLRFDSKVSTL